MKNKLITIGFIGCTRCYLNITEEEAKRRYMKSENITEEELESDDFISIYVVEFWQWIMVLLNNIFKIYIYYKNSFINFMKKVGRPQSTEICIKHGRTKSGTLRYKNKETCETSTTPEQNIENKIGDEIKQMVGQLFVENVGLRSIGRIVGISHSSVSKILYEQATDIILNCPLQIFSTTTSVEIDEIVANVKKKKDQHTGKCDMSLYKYVFVVCDRNQRILSISIGSRDKETFLPLYKKIEESNIEEVHTDGLSIYKTLFQKDYEFTDSKKYTFHIEGVNSLIRNFCACFNRKTKRLAKQ